MTVPLFEIYPLYHQRLRAYTHETLIRAVHWCIDADLARFVLRPVSWFFIFFLFCPSQWVTVDEHVWLMPREDFETHCTHMRNVLARVQSLRNRIIQSLTFREWQECVYSVPTLIFRVTWEPDISAFTKPVKCEKLCFFVQKDWQGCQKTAAIFWNQTGPLLEVFSAFFSTFFPDIISYFGRYSKLQYFFLDIFFKRQLATCLETGLEFTLRHPTARNVCWRDKK